MNGYFYVLTTIDLFVLCFMCVLTRLSESLNKKQKRGFLFAFGFIAFISILEVITLKVDGLPVRYRWINIISNYLGFGLTPSVCICLVYVLDKKTRLRWEFKLAILCEIIYLLVLAISIPAAETIIQIMVPNLHVSWLCVTCLMRSFTLNMKWKVRQNVKS